MTSIHAKKPARSKVEPKAKYTEYRDSLRADFNNACGYCDDSDARVERVLFHIDHFAPKRKFPDLETEYGNLVYACRFCNVRKSDHWVGSDSKVHNDGTKGFVDPCHVDYDDHLERAPDGRIVALSPLGNYMIGRLHLGLLRHELLWKARKVRAMQAEIKSLIDALEAAGNQGARETIDLLWSFYRLSAAVDEYELGAIHG